MTFARSKIQPPQPRQGLLLARPALERRVLDALQGHRVVLVCAPAGYGKTALLVRALAQLPPRHEAAWISLDPGDDLRRLLDCLLAALEAFDPPWRVAPEAIVATALQGDVRARQQAVDELVNALDACDLAHGVIVLDDLHHLEDEASAHFLQRLLERLGRRWTLVLASRHEPAFSLARIGAAGE
ncbi:MAG: AAA family ATPase, partial [Rubrivivax sp.]|nr:AAA family ATPase [Rubrivivax sp.]